MGTPEFGITKDFDTWKEAILQFLRDRPELRANNTRGYFRFLADRGCIDDATADKLCSLVAQGLAPKPEVYVRSRRELIEKGLISIPNAQQSFLDDTERDVRSHYRRDKKENPVWH